MVNIVQDYVESRKRLMNEFQCKDDYFIKILLRQTLNIFQKIPICNMNAFVIS